MARKKKAEVVETETRGRPTKYNDEMQAKADIYLEVYAHDLGEVVPSIAGLCKHVGVAKSTVYLWEKDNLLFSDTLKRIKEEQELKLLNGGLSSTLNSMITKLMLANHGYSDKVDTTNKTELEVTERVTLADFYGEDETANTKS